jgi:hypothetical protein
MARRRIFISHSAHRDPSALPVLHQLEAKLKSLNQDYTVLLDHSTLRPGEDWRSALDIWCGACDAAILLVTPDSMQAEYCSYEWSILSYRKARSQNFNILPVYYGATPEDLRGKPHQISEIQGVVFSTIEACWPKIEAWLGKVVTNQDPTSKQAYLLANLLRKELQDPNQRQLDNALSKSNLELADWEPLEDRWEQFAFLLVGLGVPKAVLPLAPLAWAFNGKQDSWKDVLDLVACSWIDNRSALRLEARTCGPCGDRAVALNTEEPRTARLYVVKASSSPPSNSWCTVEVAGVAADLEMLKSQIEVSLAHALHVETSPVDRPALARRLRNKEMAGRPIVVLLGTKGLDQAWLAELRQHFASVTFFLLSGTDRPALTGVEWIEPDLSPNFEVTFWDDYENSKDALDIL